MKLEEVVAYLLKKLISRRAVGLVEHIMPNDFGGHDIEDETAEEAIFGRGNEVEDLLGRAGEDGTELGLDDFDILTILLTEVRNGFVMEGFAEAVGIVAKVGIKSVGLCVALRLEEQPYPIVLRQRLIDHSGCAVGRDKEGEKGRLLRLGSVTFLLVEDILKLVVLELVHGLGVMLAQLTMDGGSRGMVGMVGLQLLDGQIGLRVAAAADVVADFLKLRKVVEDGGDGTGELIKGDLV